MKQIRRVTQRTLSPAGETRVGYYSDGMLSIETRIPGDSMFHTSGRGSGGAGQPTPCDIYDWYQDEANPAAGTIDPVSLLAAPETISVHVTQPSTAWIFEEFEPTGIVVAAGAGATG